VTPSGVFISYRREDAAPYARLLQFQLRGRFPHAQVFIDVDSIEPGLDFAEVIRDAVGSCAVLLALVGRQWLTLTDESGNRRLDDPDDYVRLEVQTALDRGVRVIPVLVDGAQPLRQHQLPVTLQKLSRLNALELSYGRYQYDADRLLDIIQRVLAVTSSGPAVTASVVTKAGHAASPDKLDEDRFLASVDDDLYREALRSLFAVAKTLGMVFEWGSVGASIRLYTPDRREPLTVAWVFPADTGWSGLRHLTVGYDEGSAAATPSVRNALAAYVEAASVIPGATPARARALRAFSFAPDAVRAQQEQLVSLLRGLWSGLQESLHQRRAQGSDDVVGNGRQG
jgi:TIR domain